MSARKVGLTVMVEPEVIARLDVACARFSASLHGIRVSRAALARRAMELGIEALEGTLSVEGDRT